MKTERGAAEPGRHPISVVAQRTGISLHVLRAWEKRYLAVEPQRTEGGQRLYTDGDVVRLRLLKALTEGGRQIGQVARLPTAALLKLVREDEAEAVAGGGPASGDAGGAGPEGSGRARSANGSGAADQAADQAAAALQGALEAGERLDASRLNSVLTRAVVSLRPGEFVAGVATPLLEEVGRSWEAGRLSPAQEHLVSAVLRRVLGWLLDTFEPVNGAPVLVATTLSGERHEFGALLAATLAAEEGWRVVYLGADLPGGEIARAARRMGSSLVALSVVHETAADSLAENLEELRRALGTDVPVVVGGRGAPAHADLIRARGATLATTFDAWPALLRSAADTGHGTAS
jgi:MerR family transcriptional regulator, light-induced transcriptional regulator